MKNVVKKFFCFFGVILFSVLATIGMVSSTFASRIEDYANSPDNLRKILQYNRAMETCMSDSLGSFSYDTSGSGQYKTENIQKSYDRLMAKKYFFNVKGKLIYSHEFERNVSEGSYDGGVFGSGNDDGKMYCYENDDKVFHNAMSAFGIAENKENLKALYCNGESSGIYTITKKKYENSKVIEEDSNCSSNFDLFVEYAERGEENPAYSISIAVSGDPVGHYQRWFNEKVGSFNSLSSGQNEAMMYAKNRHDFMTLCKPNGPFDTDPLSSNEVLVYDSTTPNKKVYYTIGVGMDDKFYTEINSSTQKTCVEMADGMTKEGAEAVASAPMVEVDENREEDVRACYKDAENALKSNGTLYIVKQRAWGIYYLADILLKQAETFKSNGYKVTGVQEIESEYGTSQNETIEFRDSTVQQFLETMNNNVADAGGGAALENFVEYMTGFSNAMVSFREKSQAEGLSDEEKQDFDAWVENCTSNVNTFNTEVVEKLNAIFASAKETVEGTDVNSMFRSGTIPAGESKIKDSIDNFYSFNNSNDISCLLVDEVLSDFARQMAEITGGDVTMDPFVAPEHIIPEDIDPNTPVEDPCYNAGIEGMSWILCPALNNMVAATDGISSLLNEWLSVDSRFYNNTSIAQKAWGYFRDMANVAVIIVLLAIITSQVTGYGIDNYGIKKMLPRLLVMAVLINLSFILCQLAVDVSNILGEGLNNMFKSIGLTIYDGAGAEGFIGSLMTGIFAALGVAGAVGGIAITFVTLASSGTGTVMIVLFAALLLIAALLAIVMFFLALGARLIVVILFTAISPLALACYILPNTQKLFKKWFDIFKTALVIYPICGALYGMSFIIKAIIFQDGNGVHLWLAMIGLIAPFLPFMILPSLTKSALAGLGALGGTLAMLGGGVKKGISNTRSDLQNSEAYKTQTEMGRRNLSARLAGLKLNKDGTLKTDANGNLETRKLGRLGKFFAGGDTGVAKRRMQAQADQRAIWQEGRFMGDGAPAALQAGIVAQRKAAEAEEVGNWETLVKDRTNDGANEEALFAQYREYMSSGNKYGARAVARIAGRRKDTAARFLSEFTSSDFSSQGSRDAATSVAKEIAEGANSRNYLSAAPLQFDFASQINKMGAGTQVADGSWTGGANFEYSGEGGWLNSSTIDQAMDNYVTDSSELVGVKGSSLSEIIGQMDKANGGQMSDKTITRLRTLATETIANRDKGPWDSTKAKQLCEMTGGAFKFENGQIIDMRGGVQRPAVEGEVLNIHNNDGSAASKIIAGPEAERQFREGRRDGSIQLPK